MLWPEGWWGQQVVGEGWIRVFEFNGDWQLFEVGWRCVWVDSAFKAVSQVKKCLSIEFLSLEWYLHCLYQWKNAFWQALKRVTKGKSKAGPWTCQTNPFIFLCKPECRRVTQLLASEPWRLATFFGFQHTWMKFKFQHILFLEILKTIAGHEEIDQAGQEGRIPSQYFFWSWSCGHVSCNQAQKKAKQGFCDKSSWTSWKGKPLPRFVLARGVSSRSAEVHQYAIQLPKTANMELEIAQSWVETNFVSSL